MYCHMLNLMKLIENKLPVFEFNYPQSISPKFTILHFKFVSMLLEVAFQNSAWFELVETAVECRQSFPFEIEIYLSNLKFVCYNYSLTQMYLKHKYYNCSFSLIAIFLHYQQTEHGQTEMAKDNYISLAIVLYVEMNGMKTILTPGMTMVGMS